MADHNDRHHTNSNRGTQVIICRKCNRECRNRGWPPPAPSRKALQPACISLPQVPILIRKVKQPKAPWTECSPQPPQEGETPIMRIRTDPRIYEIHTSTYLFFAIPWIVPWIIVSSAKQGLYVNGTLRSTKCRFLINTGSTDTIISASIYHQMDRKCQPELHPFTENIQQVDVSSLHVHDPSRTTCSDRGNGLEMRTASSNVYDKSKR